MTKTLKAVQRKYGVRILVVLLSMLFLCAYITRKEGYHMDEILAFQLANAEFNPWIVPTQPVGRLAKFMGEHIDGDTLGETVSNVVFIIKDTLANRGSSILATYKADVYDAPIWMDAKMFQDYMRCESYDDYNLLSVYFNVKDDNHPPLHFMLLHLMTSLFKGEISVWHGCLINLAAMAGTLWILGLMGDILFKRKSSSIALMILYGFSMGIVATTIWIRMYALLTLWTMWGLYLHLRKYTCADQDSFLRIRAKDGKVKWLGSISLFTITVLSFWTQYFGLFFILPLALVTVFLLWKDRRFPELWAYIRTMISAAVVGITIFPFAIQDVLFSSRGAEALNQWKNGWMEYVTRLKEFGTILAVNTAAHPLVFILIIVIPLLFIGCKVLAQKTDMHIRGVFWMCLIPTLTYFLLAAKMSPYFVDRYIMAIFPAAALLIMWLWDTYVSVWISSEERSLFAAKTACTGCVLLAVILSGMQLIKMQGEHSYLYKGYEEQLEVSEKYAQYPMVCNYVGYSFYENVLEMEHYKETILVRQEELASMDEARKEATKNGYVALIKYPSDEVGEVQLKDIMNVFGGEKAELLFSGGAFGDAIYLITP